MSKNKLTPKKMFDNIIKKNLISSGISEDSLVYSITQKDGNISKYPLYFNKAAFDIFVNEMQTFYPHHYFKYNGNSNATQNKGGVGGELIEKPSRYGLTPPKMASVASSSRFCYLALRNGTDALIENKFISGTDIDFEHECRIFSQGTAPQLDAFVEDSECNIYIEAKCHEIFDSHTVKLKNKYWDYFKNDVILKKALKGIQKGDKYFLLPLSLFKINKPSSRFDIKQLICHLLGIKEQNNGKKSKLIYLFFEPVTDNDIDATLINNVFNELADEIEQIFKSKLIKDFCKTNKIELAAIKEKGKIMETLRTTNKITMY